MRATTNDARTFATKYGFNELFYKDKRTHVFYHVEKMMKVDFMPKSSTLRVWKRGFKELYVKKIQSTVMEQYFMFPEKVKLEILVPGSKKDKEVTDNMRATANDARTFATRYGFNELFCKDKRTHVFYHVEKMMKVAFMPKSSTLMVWKRGFKELYVKKIEPAVMEQYFMFPEKVKLEILAPGSKKDKKVTGNKAEDGITKLERPLCKTNNDKPKNVCFLTSDRKDLNISFDTIAVETIFPKLEIKQEVSEPEMEIKPVDLISETAGNFPKVEIKNEAHHSEMEIKTEVKSETDKYFTSDDQKKCEVENLDVDTEYVEMEDEGNNKDMKIEGAPLNDSLSMDHSPDCRSSLSPVLHFQYSIVTPWFDQKKVESDKLNFGQPSLFSNNNHQYPDIFPTMEGEFQNSFEEPTCLSHKGSGNRHMKKQTDKTRARSQNEGKSRSRSRSRNRDTLVPTPITEHQEGEKRKLKKEREPQNEKQEERVIEREINHFPDIKVNHLTVCSTTLWIGHLSKLVVQENLYDLFGQHGEVISIDLIPLRGCAYVEMKRRTDAEKALEKLRTFRLYGKQFKMAWAPGKRVKDMEWKDYFDFDLGAFFVPLDKLDPQVDIAELDHSGLVDEDTMPGWMKNLRGIKENEEWAKTMDSFQTEYGLN